MRERLVKQPAAPPGHDESWRGRIAVDQRAIRLQQAGDVLARLKGSDKQEIDRRQSQSIEARAMRGVGCEALIGRQPDDGDLASRHAEPIDQIGFGCVRVGQDVIG